MPSDDYPQVTHTETDWETLVIAAEPRPDKVVSYEFSNGVKKYEPFYPYGTGPYKDYQV